MGDKARGGLAETQAVVEIRLLGGFGLRVGGQAVPTRSWRLRKAKDIVKILALAPGHRRHRDEVIEALWPERDSGSGLNNLHQALHIARRGLAGAGGNGGGSGGNGSGRGRLRVREEWVELCPDEPVRVDVEEFEAAAALAAAADPVSIETALRLYPGDLLPEDRYEDWALSRRDDLRARQRLLLAELAALREAAGDPQASVELLGPLVADDPTDERAQRALIRAYALTGNRGAALRQYQALAATLRDALGVGPDTQTEQVYRDVLAGGLSSGPDVTTLTTAARRENPPPPKRAVAADDIHRPARPAAVRHNLPVFLSTFVGRDSALAELGTMLAERRLITVTGPGGCGKSRLAAEAAHRALGQFPDGVWLIDLAAASGSGDHAVGRALARELGRGELSGQSPLDAVADDLAGQRCLLMLDNCEYRVDSAAHAADRLLAAGPDLVVLATSREPLRVPGEVLWRLAPLATPRAQSPAVSDTSPAALDELRRYESVQLFVDRAMAAEPGFRLDESNATAVAEICRRLDGLPLAIELAAARVPALGTAGITERLDDRFRLLTGGSRTVLSRQRTLAATFDWSYDLLDESEKATFRRLSVFAGTFSLAAAGVVAAGGGEGGGGTDVDREEVATLLPDLAARSMISIEHEPAAFRYRLIESLREYGRDRLADAGEELTARRRHAAWYLALAQETAEHFADPGRNRWFDRAHASRADFHVALASLLDANPAKALRLTAALWRYWIFHGSFAEGMEQLQAALDRTEEPSAARVEALIGSFAIRLRWTGVGRGDPSAEQALLAAKALGDRATIARAAFFVGVQAWVREEHQLARRAFLTAAATARAAGLLLVRASAVHGLGCVAWSQGRPELARARLREALALARRAADVDVDVGSFWTLNIGSVLTGRWLGVPHLMFEESPAPFQETGGLAAVAAIRATMGSLARSLGDYDAAAGLLEEALALNEEAGDSDGLAVVFGRLGNLAVAVGQLGPAAEYLTRSLAIRRELRDQRGTGLALLGLGRLEATAGRLDRAAELFTEAIVSFQGIGDRPAMMLGVVRLAELRNARRRPEFGAETVRMLESAIGVLRGMGHRIHVGLALAALADAYVVIADAGRAARAARAALDQLSAVADSLGKAHITDHLSAIAAHSGPR